MKKRKKQPFFTTFAKKRALLAVLIILAGLPVGYMAVAHAEMNEVRADGGSVYASPTEDNIYGRPVIKLREWK